MGLGDGRLSAFEPVWSGMVDATEPDVLVAFAVSFAVLGVGRALGLVDGGVDG